MPSDDPYLAFFKALADANRLRIVGLLAHRPHAVEELATVLDLRASTVSHHLGRLSKAGLVRASTSGHYHVYELDLAALEQRARSLSSTETLRTFGAVEPGLDAFDRKTLSTFLDGDGRLKQVPMKRKKFEAILRHALTFFEDDGPWTEREVNARLKRLTDDTATIRRGFIDHGLMTRDRHGQAYRRVQQEA